MKGPMQRSKEGCYSSYFIFQACLSQMYTFESLANYLTKHNLDVVSIDPCSTVG